MVRTFASLLAVMLLAPAAHADSPVPLVRFDAPELAGSVEVAPRRPFRRLGLTVTAGVPSGAAAEMVLRPWRALRLHAGGAYDLASGGVLGGLTVAPIHFPLAPVLEVELGHFFEGDASGLFASALRGQQGLLGPLRRVGYDFASAELGVELGNPDTCVFTLRAGLAVVQGTVHELAGALPAGVNVTLADPRVRAVVPSARLGFVFFL